MLVRQREAQPRYSKVYGNPLPRNTVGAIGELRVANDLLIRGYQVYRSVTPNSTYDLIATKGGQVLPIEVRTARTDAIPRTAGENKEQYALVLPDQIMYRPPLPQEN